MTVKQREESEERQEEDDEYEYEEKEQVFSSFKSHHGLINFSVVTWLLKCTITVCPLQHFTSSDHIYLANSAARPDSRCQLSRVHATADKSGMN